MSAGVPVSRRLAGAQCAIAVLLALSLGVLIALLALDSSYTESLSDKAPDVIMALTLTLVGVVVTLKRPENLVGWAMSVPGVALLGGGVLEAYANVALLAKPEAGLPGGTVALALSGGVWTALMAGLFVLLVVFPAGRMPRRWRLVARLVLVGLGVVWAIITILYGPQIVHTIVAAMHEHIRYVLGISGILVVLIAVWVVRKLFDKRRGTRFPVEEDVQR